MGYCAALHLSIAQLCYTMSYVPYIGETPLWLRVVILVVGSIQGFHHLAPLVLENHKLIDSIFGLATLVGGLPSIVFLFSHWGAHLPVVTTVALILAFVLIAVLPGKWYEKKTNKQVQATHSGVME